MITSLPASNPVQGHDNSLGDEEAKARFLREARAAAALQHPNICTIHEIDEADGRTFIVMAYLEGEELRKHIEKGPLSLAKKHRHKQIKRRICENPSSIELSWP